MSRVADLLVEDAEGENVLVVKTRAGVFEDLYISWHVDYLRSLDTHAPFGMLVDREKIRVIEFAEWDGATFAAVLDTAEVLSSYEPDYRSKRVYQYYMEGLTGAWLADLALHWKHPKPPGTDELARIGLLQRIAGGQTHREVEFATHPVP
jgi:hypothetical protein